MAQYVYTMRRVGKVVPPKRTILKNISLNFFPGAKIGVLGLNGSGKSSLLRIMAGADDNYEGEVVRITREFLATLSPYDIARLPPHCRPGKMVDGTDISGYAFVIVRHRCVPGAGTARVAHKLASFFTSASTRLARICSMHQPVPRSGDHGSIGRTA